MCLRLQGKFGEDSTYTFRTIRQSYSQCGQMMMMMMMMMIIIIIIIIIMVVEVVVLILFQQFSKTNLNCHQ